MEKNYEYSYHQMESDRWWFYTRRDIVIKLIENFKYDDFSKLKVLDIGCSSGHLLMDLEDKGFDRQNLYGIDVSTKAINQCHRNGFHNTYVMDATNSTFTDIKFDILIASDCLEHIAQDELALASWKNIKKKEGRLIIFVPAFSILWSDHDVINHHHRRYTLNELRLKTKMAGFKILQTGYWNFFLFIPVLIVNLIIKRPLNNKVHHNTKSNWDYQPKSINGILKTLLLIENFLIINLRIRLPVGISTYCILE